MPFERFTTTAASDDVAAVVLVVLRQNEAGYIPIAPAVELLFLAQFPADDM